MPTPPTASAVPLTSPRRGRPSESERNAEFLNRATNGYTPEEHARLNGMGRASWLREQLGLVGNESPLLLQALTVLPSLELSGQAFYDTYRGRDGEARREIQNAAFTRAVLSRWQLRERMMDFWHDHFSVALRLTTVTRLGHHAYDREVIRAHVFGSFKEMLHASAKSMSMLKYLNGEDNVASGPNENYAREVMELHTLGVNGPYTETDVTELARCFTGWDYYGPTHSTRAGQFRFRANRHDDDPKTVLGLQIPSGGGVKDGETVLSFLASSPSTVDFVCRKLVRRFVSETAPEDLVEKIKSVWFRSQGDLKVVTAALFSDGISNVGRPWDNRKVKRPFQFAAGLLRAAGVSTDNAYDRAVLDLRFMGQEPFNWPAPNGYPDSSAAWSGGLVTRWEFANDVLRGNQSGLDFPDQSLIRIRAGVPIGELALQIDRVFTGGRSAADDVARVQRFISSRPQFNSRDFRDALAMMASTPDFLLA